MFKVIVAGGREFTNFRLLSEKLDIILANKTDIEIVSGCCRGADKLGEKYAKMKGYPVKEFPADFDRLGKKGGPIRNGQMAEYADALVLFWDGMSRGSNDMREQAEEKGMPIRIVKY